MASRKRIIVSAIVAVAVGVAVPFFLPKPLLEFSPEELVDEVHRGYVHEVVIDDDVLTGYSARRGPFRVNLKRGDTSLLQQLTAAGIELKHEPSSVGDF